MSDRRVLIVEDDALLRTLLSENLIAHGYVTDVAATAAEARAKVEEFRPHVMTIDVELGAGPTGLDLAESILRTFPSIGLVFLTHLPDPRFIGSRSDSIPAHAAYIRKDSIAEPGALAAVIQRVLDREISDEMREHKDPDRPLAKLSRSQIDVLRMIALGMSNADIAQERDTTIRAVEHLVRRTLIALDVSADSTGHARIAAVRKFVESAGLPLNRA